MPRKNAKSTIAAGIGLYKFAADHEFGAECYSGATSEKQAWEVFRPAKQMAERTPALLKAFGIEVNAKNLFIPGNGSRFEPVIGKPGDGAMPSCAIVDEYHEHPDDTLYDTMKTGMGARENPLLLVITTAGSDQAGPCFHEQNVAQDILAGRAEDERYFALIFGIDEGDDWKSEAALLKANPNIDVSVFRESLLEDQQAAIRSARKQNVFKTKHLNVWVNADVAWLPEMAWEKCKDSGIRLADFEKQECVLGIDLASVIDIASKVRLFRKRIDGKIHYYLFADHYLNEQRIRETSNQHYAGWVNSGHLIQTPGNATDYPRITADIVDDTQKYIVREVAHDPYHAAALMQFAQQDPKWPKNITVVDVRQNTANMSPAMKECEAIVLDGRLHHTGDPVLAWMISNVVCHIDRKGDIFPNKKQPENKIDGAVALFVALCRATALPMDSGRKSIFDHGSFWSN